MANTIRIKRSTGSTAPASLANAELAFAEGIGALYIGVGTGGANSTATTIPQIGSTTLFATQTVRHVYAANATTGVPGWRALEVADISSLGTALDAKAALSGATFTGGVTFNSTVSLGDSATATTPNTNDDSTKVATTAWVKAQNYGSSNAAGTVTSVGLSLPNIFTVSNSPVTTTGTLTGTLATQTPNHVWAGPASGATAAAPTFRALVSTDLPSHSHSVSDVFGNQTANTVFAGPNATTGAPTFRALVAGDIPSITAAKVSDFDTQVRSSRLDQMATPTASVAMGSQRITGLADPSSAQDAATKAYVDATAVGLDPKPSVRGATTQSFASGTLTVTRSGNVLSNTAVGAFPNLDGITWAVGDRILIKNEGTTANNGIYTITSLGSAGSAWQLTRATDADTSAEVTPGMFVFVEEGTNNQDTGWILSTNGPITLNSTGLNFVQFSSAGVITDGTGLLKTGNTLALTGQALSLHNLSSNGFFVRTGAGTVAARSIAVSGSGLSTVTNADGVSGNPTLSLTAALSSVGGLTPAADKLAYYTGSSTATLTDLSSFARGLLDDVDNNAARSTLGLGTIATQAANNVAITGGSIDNITIDGGTW